MTFYLEIDGVGDMIVGILGGIRVSRRDRFLRWSLVFLDYGLVFRVVREICL